MNTEQCNTTNRFCGIKCVSWSAIILGALAAIGLTFLLSLFSTAIGLSIYKVSPEGVSKLAVGGMLGFAIGIIATMFFAGWIAGYFGRSHCDVKHCGPLYGFASWCLALILMILLTMPFSRFVTNYTSYLTNTTVSTERTITIDKGSNSMIATVTGPTEQAANDLGKGAFVLFLMFFLGALASTVGGHVGVCGCQKGCCHRPQM